MKCPECTAENVKELANQAHLYVESGLRNITLRGIKVLACDQCGARTPVIPKIEQLHRVIAQLVIEKKSRLEAEEIRFLRKYLGYSSIDLAATMGVTRETVSRWENGQEPMGAPSEKLLRLMVAHSQLIGDYGLDDLREAGSEDRQEGQRFDVVTNARGWALAAA
jgi:putative zinc finger/helix-turn-helix YgiT family protein